jgi:hypothetical protein
VEGGCKEAEPDGSGATVVSTVPLAGTGDSMAGVSTGGFSAGASSGASASASTGTPAGTSTGVSAAGFALGFLVEIFDALGALGID